MPQDPLFLVSMYLFVAVVLRFLKPGLLSAVFLASVILPSTIYLAARHGDEILLAVYRTRDSVLTTAGHPPAWPPECNRTYPDLDLLDKDGHVRRLSEFHGKIILLQPVSLACPASVAFAGGQVRGAFRATAPQPDLESIEVYADRFGDVRLDDPRVVLVQLVLFNEQMQAPTPAELAEWEDQFALPQTQRVVLGAPATLANQDNTRLVPGFQLIDQNFMLRMDSTGYRPRNDLYGELLPLLGKLLRP